jgi:hypothetical protein
VVCSFNASQNLDGQLLEVAGVPTSGWLLHLNRRQEYGKIKMFRDDNISTERVLSDSRSSLRNSQV